MSRICIKNLSKSATEKQLQELFGQKGEVTDIKVLKTKGGQVRRMAFVGYRTEAQAQEAQRYFHNTFMGMSRIAVEIAKKYEKKADAPHIIKSNRTVAYDDDDDDDEATREPSATAATGTSKSEGIIGKKKAEFIALMRNRSNTSRWTNDDGQVPILDPDLSSNEHASDIDDDDDDVNYKLVTNEGAAASTQDADGSEHARPLSDMDYLRSKVRRHSSSQSDSEADEEHDEHDDHDTNNKEVSGAADEENNAQPYRVIPEEGSMEEDTARLFVKNLPFSCSEEEFRSLLEPFGPVEVHLPLDADKRGKGFGFAEYMLPDHAALACAQLSGEAFQGRVLHVTKANRRIEKVVEVGGTSSQLSTQKTSKLSSFQQKKEEERRKFLSRKEGWNASFVRSDTVVDALADRHGVSSADILDTSRSGGDIAVRLAVGESNIIQENRDFLSSSGIDVAVLESHHSSHKGSTRSTTSFLVKNLPPNSQSDELESMFARYGNCSCSMAPSKTLLLVEFIEPSEARAALKGLAYRNYKHSPLYLEWAPLSNAANGNVVVKKKDHTTIISTEQEASSSSVAVESLRSTDEDQDKDNQQSYSTLFVKNINFSTTEDALRSHLESLGVEGLRTVLIQKKMVGTHLLSQGYGFVEFRSAESAARSLVRMNGSLLDSHALEVKPSDKRVSAAPTQAVLSKSVLSGGINKLNSRIVVRNVAFQSTKAEIRSLFSSFGSVQTVRMPKKMGGEHRGFAFVEFSTAQEAAQAMASLRNTHLYGRHLVLEWAKDDDQDEFQAGGSKTATSGASASNAVQAPVGVTASGAAIDKLRRRARQDVQAIAAQQKRRKVEDVLDSSHMVTADDI